MPRLELLVDSLIGTKSLAFVEEILQLQITKQFYGQIRNVFYTRLNHTKFYRHLQNAESTRKIDFRYISTNKDEVMWRQES